MGRSDPARPLPAAPAAAAAGLATLAGAVRTCATTPVTAYGPMAVQEFGDDPTVGALVSSGPGRTFALTPAQWGGYHQTGSKDGSQAATIAGPIEVVVVTPGASVLRTANGEVRGTRPDNPHFFVPRVVGDLARTRPDLGGVTSNVHFVSGTLVQDFEHGVVTLGSGSLRVDLVADPAAALPPRDVRRHILRSPDATSWWVDGDGRRHWLPDGGQYQCVGGEAVALAPDVVSYAIATLPDGGPEHCPPP